MAYAFPVASDEELSGHLFSTDDHEESFGVTETTMKMRSRVFQWAMSGWMTHAGVTTI